MRSTLTALFVFLVLPSCMIAQKTEADLRARLINKPLYLRGLWSADKLAFDDAGRVAKPVAPTSFTLAGVEIESVKLTAGELILEGQRVGLEFDKDVPRRVGMIVRGGWVAASPEKMTIRIKMPADGDFTAALDAIFVDHLADLIPQLPWIWQTFAQKSLLPASAAAGAAQAPGTTKLPRIGGVTAPRILTKVDPHFDNAARAMRYSGIVLVNLVVDKAGKPTHLQILHPAGLGLDESALAAVSRYTFQPAMKNGSPVAVELAVDY